MILRRALPNALRGLCGLALLACAEMPQGANAREAITATTPQPVKCDVAPRSAAEIVALAASAPEEAEPARALPAGEPADAATTAAIVGVLEEMSACLTAGQMHRFYALHSDEWLRRFTAGIEDLTTFTTSTPPLADGQTAVYLGPWHVQTLADGRVMAAVLLRVGDELRPAPNRVRVLLFVRRDGRWLVDETIERVKLADCASPVEVAAVVGPPPGAVFDTWSASCGDDVG